MTALDTDDEILQDFLIEAEEILEGLNEQLVELENSPEDADLLNAIFRGFHTIKGGAGFLALENMVNVCHKGEDVFNLLRQGERVVDADMMDTFLKVLDTLHIMFDEIKGGQQPSPAEDMILDALASYLSEDAPAPATTPAPTEPEPVAEAPATSTNDDDITEDEFEALLDQLHGNSAPGSQTSQPAAEETPAPATPAAPPSNGDDIIEEEFEALLD
jgi:two-component system chemotaxis sensor kinase CheA